MFVARVLRSPARNAHRYLTLALLFSACSGGASKDSTPTIPSVPAPVLSTVLVALSPTTIQVGQTSSASASGFDQNGNSITIGSVVWSSGSASIASVATSGVVTGTVTGIAPGQAQVIATSGGKQGLQLITVTAVPVSSVSVTPSAATLAIGATQQLAASTLDASGNLLAGRVVTWNTSDATKATVSTSGLVTAVAAGSVTITATSESKTGSANITISPPPVASVTVTPATSTLGVGSTQQLTATLKDVSGNVLTGQGIVWATSDGTKATVSQTGLVTAVTIGTATITASSGGKSGTATITVAVVPVASVTVTPTTGSIVVGGTLTVTATALDANGNVLAGQTWNWTSTNLSVVSGTFVGNVLTATGVGVGSATVTATAGGKSGSSVITVSSGATSVVLSAPGQSAAFLNSPNFAAALTVQPGSQYLIAVVNTDATSASLEDFTLATTFGAASMAGIVRGPVTPSLPSAERTPNASGPRAALPNSVQQQIAVQQQAGRNHMAMLEQNRQIFARYGSPSAAWAKERAQRGRTASISASVTQTIGAVNKVYVKKALSGSCNAVDSIAARTVAVGQHVIVLADTNRTTWPQAYRPDTSFYQAFANEYDQITYPTLLSYIGNPLAYDASLSGTGKVTVTITPELNNLGGVSGGGTYVAFVSGCDFYPFVASGVNTFYSNQTEMMYSLVPSANGYSVAGWEAELRATAAHESKHIVSIADRALLGAAGFDEVWLEEGLAQVSSEIWERNFNQATWKGNASFAQTVACEFDLAFASYLCDANNNKPSALMGSHLPFFFTYLQRESSFNSEGLDVDGQANYGAGWALSRWAIDQFASGAGEGAFIQSLINTTQTGLTNLSSHTGQSIPALLTYWNAAAAIFQTPSYTAADVRLTNPSFNFAQIFQIGQTGWTCGGSPCGFFTSGAPSPVYPVAPIAFSTGAFSRTVHTVPGTSASFFLLSGASAGIETLNLLSGSGGALSANSGFRVLILRVQ